MQGQHFLWEHTEVPNAETTCRHCHGGWNCSHRSRVQQTPKRPIHDRHAMKCDSNIAWAYVFVTSHYQVVEAEGPFRRIEAHGCCGALCLLWLRLWAAGSHCRLPTKWNGVSNLCTSRSSCQASLAPPVAWVETPGRKVLGSTAAGAADGCPWSWYLGPSNPGEASANALDA